MHKWIMLLALATGTQFVSAQAVKTAATQPAKAATPTAVSEDKEKKSEFVERLFSEQDYLTSQIVDKCFTFNFSPTCWAKFIDPANDGNSSGFGAMRYWMRFTTEYAKRQGLGDLEGFNVSDKAIEKENRPLMDEIIAKLRDQFSLTVNAGTTNCTIKGYTLMMQYPYEVLQRIGSTTPEWAPTSGKAFFTVNMDAAAKDVAVAVNPNGTITVTGPAQIEPVDSSGKIEKGMQRANKNR